MPGCEPEHRVRSAIFYLANRDVGVFVLVLTLYATQYSGNTLFGFSGKAYRVGFSWIMCIHFMTAIVVVYLTFAPKLHALSRVHGFVTPTDYLDHRYRSRRLNVLATLLMIAALANYLLAQLMAMGRALEGLVPAHADSAYIYGVLVLAAIIGGLRVARWLPCGHLDRCDAGGCVNVGVLVAGRLCHPAVGPAGGSDRHATA